MKNNSIKLKEQHVGDFDTDKPSHKTTADLVSQPSINKETPLIQPPPEVVKDMAPIPVIVSKASKDVDYEKVKMNEML